MLLSATGQCWPRAPHSVLGGSSSSSSSFSGKRLPSPCLLTSAWVHLTSTSAIATDAAQTGGGGPTQQDRRNNRAASRPGGAGGAGGSSSSSSSGGVRGGPQPGRRASGSAPSSDAAQGGTNVPLRGGSSRSSGGSSRPASGTPAGSKVSAGPPPAFTAKVLGPLSPGASPVGPPMEALAYPTYVPRNPGITDGVWGSQDVGVVKVAQLDAQVAITSRKIDENGALLTSPSPLASPLCIHMSLICSLTFPGLFPGPDHVAPTGTPSPARYHLRTHCTPTSTPTAPPPPHPLYPPLRTHCTPTSASTVPPPPHPLHPHLRTPCTCPSASTPLAPLLRPAHTPPFSHHVHHHTFSRARSPVPSHTCTWHPWLHVHPAASSNTPHSARLRHCMMDSVVPMRRHAEHMMGRPADSMTTTCTTTTCNTFSILRCSRVRLV